MLKNVAVLVISFVATAFTAEFAARVAFPEWAPRTGTVTQFWQYDPNYGWSHVPRAEGRFASYGFDTVVRINSQGFRGRDISPDKDPSKYRILVLGDSYVWGFGVQEDQVFTAQMEQLCSGIEAINFGVSGYSTDQELLLYQEKGIDYHPDMVILVVAGNDFDEE